jgi:hypothetical protein
MASFAISSPKIPMLDEFYDEGKRPNKIFGSSLSCIKIQTRFDEQLRNLILPSLSNHYPAMIITSIQSRVKLMRY